MSKYVKQYGRVFIYALPLIAVAALLLFLPSAAEGGSPYSDPFWTHTSSDPECGVCNGCGSPCAPEFSEEGVSVRTGELVLDLSLFTTPGMVSPNFFSLRYRSMNSGTSQLGNRIIPSWETTAKEIILNSGDPDARNGTKIEIRRSSGLMDAFFSDGAGGFYASGCLVTDTLTVARQTGIRRLQAE